MKINVLSQSIANMIAAGEVVERPASVVKELAENSVDAGAKSITIEIKKGGMSYIRITDDGCGIEADEVLTAFKRHATSKIKTKEDLNAIYTLGFRGEALASIAAVSKLDIFTKTYDNPLGYTAQIHGGEAISYSEAGCPDGTTITVRDLFYNTPARMKFLKSDATETSYVTDSVHKLILSHPEISVKLIVNGKTTLSSPGDGKLSGSIRAVFGKDYIRHMNEVDYTEDGIKVTGLVGTNALARKDRRQQVFFINGRYIKSKIISAALSEAYQNVMMIGKYPVAVLNITVNGSFVDVNVHPTKIEVRFSDDKKVYNSIYWAVKNALSAKKYVPEIDIKTANEKKTVMDVREQIVKKKNEAVQSDINLLKDTYLKNHVQKPTYSSDINDNKSSSPVEKSVSYSEPLKIENVATEDNIKLHIDQNSFFQKNDLSSFVEKTNEAGQIPENISTESKAPDINSLPEESATSDFDGFKIIGQIFGTYIIVQRANNMLIIDQHAAHERIYFEELLADFKARDIKKQILLMPETIDFDPIQFETVMENLDVLSDLGYDCEQFGERSLIIRAVPGFMPQDSIQDSIAEIANLLTRGTKDVRKTLMEDILHTMACKRAVKGNTNLTEAEMEALCESVFAFDSINTCPHGRPIMTSMSKYELEKSFKRIV